MIKKFPACVLLGLGLFFGSTTSQACDGLGFGYGLGYDYGNLYRHMSANVPHFAAFPPVYYSLPVPRTYGHSPFAYPPYFKTPELAAPVEPLTILNPHVEQNEAADQEPADKTASSRQVQPLMVYNPYVRSAAQVASTSGGSR